jgi:hypothetical protein
MRISYRSNRPDVVSVHDRDVIRTVGSGVATVTVFATYHDVTRSASFVVYVR